jgi:hypothetical protein
MLLMTLVVKKGEFKIRSGRMDGQRPRLRMDAIRVVVTMPREDTWFGSGQRGAGVSSTPGNGNLSTNAATRMEARAAAAKPMWNRVRS